MTVGCYMLYKEEDINGSCFFSAGNKPCIVHRDVNSNNVLISSDGSCRLADLGLAQTLRPRSLNTAPTRYTEVSFLKFLKNALRLAYKTL